MQTYSRFAEVYDAIYEDSDEERAAAVTAIVDARRNTSARSLLDAGCGTGRHLTLLGEQYEVTGLDRSGEMLALARQRLPGIEFREGDMRDFDLGRRFDVVTSFGGAIGYVGDRDGLGRAAASMARHLEPGGVLLIAPWVHPEAYEEGRLAVEVADKPEMKVAMMSRSDRRGNVSVLDFHVLVLTSAGAEHFVEHHELTMFTVDEYLAALTGAGLRAEHLPDALSERGLFVGVKPA